MIRLLVCCIAIVLLASSCRSTRKIQTAIAKRDTISTPIATTPHIEPKDDSTQKIKQTFDLLNSNKIDFTTFSAKINVDYSGGDGKKNDVNANLRMYKDSAIWISVTAIFGIEGIRALITRDSVKVIDKMNKTYTARSVAYLQEVSKLPLDLHTLQELLIGNPVFIDSNIVSFSATPELTSLITLGTYFKNLVTINSAGKVEHSKLDDRDPARSRTCDLSYDDYENKKGVNFSTKRRIMVTEKSKLDLKLDFKQYEFNQTVSFPFSIPKNVKTN